MALLIIITGDVASLPGKWPRGKGSSIDRVCSKNRGSSLRGRDPLSIRDKRPRFTNEAGTLKKRIKKEGGEFFFAL